jgi:uncharacterized protein (DUF1015 family)
MPEIAPLKGLLYNQQLIRNMDEVITPPFDVISPEEQEMYYKRHPYNMIRLILGQRQPKDDEYNNWYTRAAEALRSWQEEAVLIRDAKPAFYDYEIDYQESSHQLRMRQGVICLVRLQEFSHGSVLPHERTYEGTKSERLKLMRACNANLSQVFALYPDPSQEVSECLRQGREERLVFDFTDSTGIHHRMWRVSQTEVVHKVVEYMRDKVTFIADGHHRYETALNYQRLMQQKYPARGEKASFNYVLMYLANMHQEGLSILPTHRLFVHLPQFEMETFLARATDYFEVVSFPFTPASRSKIQGEFLKSLHRPGDHQVIGFYVSKSEKFVILKLREDVSHDAWRVQLPVPLQKLDVVVLTELILKKLLNVDEALLNDETRIKYSHDAMDAIEEVRSNRFKVVFLLNHTKIEQLQEIATSGLFMPHKSTYFYPKVIDGSVLNLLDPHEDVPI